MFGRIKDMRNMRERKRRIEGSRILFLRDGGGGIFGVFLGLFFEFLQSIQRKLNFDNQKKLLLP